MIITPVQKVKSCITCPNFRKRLSSTLGESDYICISSMKKIGSSINKTTHLNLRNKVSDLCPHRNDEVNQRPKRRR